MGISVGIVGVGQFGTGFVRLFRDHPLVDRVALCDLEASRLSAAARRFGIEETYRDLEAICRSDLRAIALFTQPWLHAPQAVQALEAGKHVYSAVPVVSLPDGEACLEWCDRLVAACHRTGMHYMMGETSYYRPQAVYCRRRAAEGAFGRFVLAEGQYFHDVDDPGCSLREVARRRWGGQWDRSKSGGIPMHYPTHSIGGFLSAMGTRLTQVSARGFVLPGDDWFREDTESGNLFSNETALFRCANGAAARVCEYRRIGHPGRESFQLFGTEASFVDDHGGCRWMTRQGDAPLSIEEMREPLPPEVFAAWRRGARSDAEVYGGHGGSHAYLVHEFVDAVASDRRPAISAWEAARYFVPGVVAHQSALRDGELLDIPDWGEPPAP
ncbi:MAG: Gfo/Idh/MocA family protein [Candidatus Brocadiia bacterium]